MDGEGVRTYTKLGKLKKQKKVKKPKGVGPRKFIKGRPELDYDLPRNEIVEPPKKKEKPKLKVVDYKPPPKPEKSKSKLRQQSEEIVANLLPQYQSSWVDFEADSVKKKKETLEKIESRQKKLPPPGFYTPIPFGAHTKTKDPDELDFFYAKWLAELDRNSKQKEEAGKKASDKLGSAPLGKYETLNTIASLKAENPQPFVPRILTDAEAIKAGIKTPKTTPPALPVRPPPKPLTYPQLGKPVGPKKRGRPKKTAEPEPAPLAVPLERKSSGSKSPRTQKGDLPSPRALNQTATEVKKEKVIDELKEGVKELEKLDTKDESEHLKKEQKLKKALPQPKGQRKKPPAEAPPVRSPRQPTPSRVKEILTEEQEKLQDETDRRLFANLAFLVNPAHKELAKQVDKRGESIRGSSKSVSRPPTEYVSQEEVAKATLIAQELAKAKSAEKYWKQQAEAAAPIIQSLARVKKAKATKKQLQEEAKYKEAAELQSKKAEEALKLFELQQRQEEIGEKIATRERKPRGRPPKIPVKPQTEIKPTGPAQLTKAEIRAAKTASKAAEKEAKAKAKLEEKEAKAKAKQEAKEAKTKEVKLKKVKTPLEIPLQPATTDISKLSESVGPLLLSEFISPKIDREKKISKKAMKVLIKKAKEEKEKELEELKIALQKLKDIRLTDLEQADKIRIRAERTAYATDIARVKEEIKSVSKITTEAELEKVVEAEEAQKALESKSADLKKKKEKVDKAKAKAEEDKNKPRVEDLKSAAEVIQKEQKELEKQQKKLKQKREEEERMEAFKKFAEQEQERVRLEGEAEAAKAAEEERARIEKRNKTIREKEKAKEESSKKAGEEAQAQLERIKLVKASALEDRIQKFRKEEIAKVEKLVSSKTYSSVAEMEKDREKRIAEAIEIADTRAKKTAGQIAQEEADIAELKKAETEGKLKKYASLAELDLEKKQEQERENQALKEKILKSQIEEIYEEIKPYLLELGIGSIKEFNALKAPVKFEIRKAIGEQLSKGLSEEELEELEKLRDKIERKLKPKAESVESVKSVKSVDSESRTLRNGLLKRANIPQSRYKESEEIRIMIDTEVNRLKSLPNDLTERQIDENIEIAKQIGELYKSIQEKEEIGTGKYSIGAETTASQIEQLKKKEETKQLKKAARETKEDTTGKGLPYGRSIGMGDLSDGDISSEDDGGSDQVKKKISHKYIMPSSPMIRRGFQHPAMIGPSDHLHPNAAANIHAMCGGLLKQDMQESYNKVVPKALRPAVEELAKDTGAYAMRSKPVQKLRRQAESTYKKAVPKSLRPAVEDLGKDLFKFGKRRAGYGKGGSLGGSMKEKLAKMYKKAIPKSLRPAVEDLAGDTAAFAIRSKPVEKLRRQAKNTYEKAVPKSLRPAVEELAKDTGSYALRQSGFGLKKGSEEARKFMAALRARKGKKGKGGKIPAPPSRSPITDPSLL